jgi:uncharacterized protein
MAEAMGPSKVELCVFCRRHPVDARWRPFCSQRCQLQDLGRWAGGAYRVPADEADPGAAETEDEPNGKPKA